MLMVEAMEIMMVIINDSSCNDSYGYGSNRFRRCLNNSFLGMSDPRYLRLVLLPKEQWDTVSMQLPSYPK